MKNNCLIQSLLLILICLSFTPSDLMGDTLTEAEKQELFVRAREFFRRGNEAAVKDPEGATDLYRKAVMRFERIVREGGVQNGKLYYNIGNNYFRIGDLGLAILNYRRAQRYLSNDSNLLQNLEYTRSRRYDEIEEKQQTKILKTMLFWHYDLSPTARFVIFAVCFAAFWLGASIRLLSLRATPRWVLVCLGAVAVIFFTSLTLESIMESRSRAGVILASEVIGRKGDGETYQPGFKEPLHSGTEFKLVEYRNGWYQIELSDGRRCWIPENTAGLVW